MRTAQIAGNLSVFSLLAIAGEYTKALQENPNADRKKTLRKIKQKAMEYRSVKDKKENKDSNQNEIIMKRIIQQTKELISLIDEEVKNREKKQVSRSQNGKKDREYQEETEILSEMLNNLNDAICGLKSK